MGQQRPETGALEREEQAPERAVVPGVVATGELLERRARWPLHGRGAAVHRRHHSYADVAKMLSRHEQGVLNYFSAAPVTNATAEGLNSKIQTIKKMAYGFRNKEHFKTAIFFHCGGLQLLPGYPRNCRMTRILFGSAVGTEHQPLPYHGPP